MSAGNPASERGPRADGGDGISPGGSGEGAGSALEAMLRKRQMRADPQPDPGQPDAEQQDGKSAQE